MEINNGHLGEAVDALLIAEDSSLSKVHTGSSAVGLNNTTAATEDQHNASKASGKFQDVTFCRSIEIQDWNNRRLDYTLMTARGLSSNGFWRIIAPLLGACKPRLCLVAVLHIHVLLGLQVLRTRSQLNSLQSMVVHAVIIASLERIR